MNTTEIVKASNKQLSGVNPTFKAQLLELKEAFNSQISILGEKSQIIYKLNLDHFYSFVSTHKKNALDVQAVNHYIKSMKADGLSNSTINNKLSSLRKLCKIAAVKYRTWVNPFDSLELKSEKVEREFKKLPLSREELQRLIEADGETKRELNEIEQLTRTRDKLIIKFLGCTGLRLNGLINILRSDIIQEGGQCKVKYLCKRHHIKDSFIIIDCKFCDELKAFWKLCESKGITSDHAFYSLGNRSSSEPLKERALQKIVKRKADAAGLSNVSVHTLRHTAACLMLENNTPIAVIKEVLNHKSLETTLLYTELAIKKSRVEDAPEIKLFNMLSS